MLRRLIACKMSAEQLFSCYFFCRGMWCLCNFMEQQYTHYQQLLSLSLTEYRHLLGKYSFFHHPVISPEYICVGYLGLM